MRHDGYERFYLKFWFRSCYELKWTVSSCGCWNCGRAGAKMLTLRSILRARGFYLFYRSFSLSHSVAWTQMSEVLLHHRLIFLVSHIRKYSCFVECNVKTKQQLNLQMMSELWPNVLSGSHVYIGMTIARYCLTFRLLVFMMEKYLIWIWSMVFSRRYGWFLIWFGTIAVWNVARKTS